MIRFVIILLFLLPVYASAQTEVTKFKISKDHVFIYLTSGIDFHSQLNSNKDRIIIKIPGAKPSGNLKQLNSTGKIQEVNYKVSKDTTIININLLEKRGYSAIQLPYSNIIFVSVINWNDLSPSEDSFNSGLLAYEDKLFASANKFFEKASELNNKKAKALLAFQKISFGKYDDALRLLEDASSESTVIPDINAGFSQVYKAIGNDSLAGVYSQKFLKSVNLKYFSDIPVTVSSDSSVVNNYPLTHLELLYNEADNSIEEPETSGDELDNKFSSLFADSVASESAGADSNSAYNGGSLIKNVLAYAALLAVGLAGILIFLYLKWRQKQLKQYKNKDFEDQLSKAREELKPKDSNPIENTKKDKGHLIDSTIIDDNTSKDMGVEQQDQNETDSGDDESINDEQDITDNDELEEQTVTAEESKKPFSEITIDSPAKIELAKKLSDEQQRIKKRKLNSLDHISIDSSKLSEVAKKLGLESGSIETKKAYDNLAKDKNTLDKLSKKFNLK